jgi:2-hydroxy-4-(methylsulfanyl)butanoate S-methyltransferase
VSAVQDVHEISAIGYGFMATKALCTALDLEIFTHLAEGPRTPEQLQARCGAVLPPLRTLLHACAGLGLLVRAGDAYANAPGAQQYLVRGAPRYFGDYFRFQIDRQIYPALAQLGDALRGRPTRPLYALMASPDEAALFSDAQHVGSLGPAHLLAQRVDAAGWRQLLDVAGGSGAFSIALCRRHPQLAATILDFESVLTVAGRQVTLAGLAGRIALLPGEALATAWPGEQDAVLMSYLLSAVPATVHAALLAKAHAALRPGGLLLVHDFVLDPGGDGPRHAALWLLANAISGPQQASFDAAELARAGFEDIQSQALLPGITRLVQARRPA